jgi:glycosyltransferase involved in cell wall biosynthesis
MILIGIPTRNRPDYLAALLSSILFQSYQDFDVLIVDTASSDENRVEDSTIVGRFINALRGGGHKVDVVSDIPACGRSEAVAVNYILSAAKIRGYDLVYKIDDDHVLEPTCLKQLADAFYEKNDGSNIIVSGVTPWMHSLGPGMSSPFDRLRRNITLGQNVSFLMKNEEGTKVVVNHFDRYEEGQIKPTRLASAANFLMKPDMNVLWSDVSPSSFFVDAMWFLRLQHFLNYSLFFHLGVNVWHVAADTGGVRVKEGDLEKDSKWDKHNFDLLCRFAEDLKEI